MGKFACRCGYIISDSSYPCSAAGELKWEPESESQSEQASRDVKDFLNSIEKEISEDWIRNYFGDQYMNIYPHNLSIAEVIDDIYSNTVGKLGHSVYQCPECERLYLQEETYTDGWICFEKVE